jgi:hypothetical protein
MLLATYYGDPMAPTWAPQNPTNPTNPTNPNNPVHGITLQQGAQSMTPIPDSVWSGIAWLIIGFIFVMSIAIWFKVRKPQ